LVARQVVSQLLVSGGNYLLNLEQGTQEIKITPLRSLETGKN